MPLTTGIEHVALVSKDIDALIDFYISVFDATVLFDLADDAGGRHAGIQVGGAGYLHPFQQPENAWATGSPDTFRRGHLDHVSLSVADTTLSDDLRVWIDEAEYARQTTAVQTAVSVD